MNIYTSALFQDATYFRQYYDLKGGFEREPGRFEALTLDAPGIKADMSKCIWDRSVVLSLLKLAREAGVEQRRDAMLAGEHINTTEDRPVLHAGLRAAVLRSPQSRDDDALTADVRSMLALAERIRADGSVRDVVHIGIGGSALGPELVTQALAGGGGAGQRLHFVSNMDGGHLEGVLAGLEPASTVFVVASKSWSTLETLRNARSALAWFIRLAPGLSTQKHFIALSARPERAQAMGFGTVVGMPEGIGGRYSL